MLSDWQKKFPESFRYYQSRILCLDDDSQQQLFGVMALLETKGLLTEKIVNLLLKDGITCLEPLNYLIEMMVRLESLSLDALERLFESNILAVKDSIEFLSNVIPVSSKILLFILSKVYPEECAHFIARSVAANVDIEIINVFLFNHIKMNGLSRALFLFGRSQFDFSQENLPMFCALTEVLAIPLCQTIFDARTRAQSDYDIPSEPIRLPIANDIVNQLVALPDEESKVRTFFNFFTRFRPMPSSQKYMVEIDVASMVVAVLSKDCETTIHSIQCRDDLLKAQQRIKKLKLRGGDKEDFDKIKYEVGNWIESMDWYSTRSYEQLMEEIWQALSVPQAELSSFTELFEETTVYLQAVGEGLLGNGLFVQPAGDNINTKMDALNKLSL